MQQMWNVCLHEHLRDTSQQFLVFFWIKLHACLAECGAVKCDLGEFYLRLSAIK